jgi:hypothetical protein
MREPKHLKARPAAAAGSFDSPFAQQRLRYPQRESLLAHPLGASEQDHLRKAILLDGSEDPIPSEMVANQRVQSHAEKVRGGRQFGSLRYCKGIFHTLRCHCGIEKVREK